MTRQFVIKPADRAYYARKASRSQWNRHGTLVRETLRVMIAFSLSKLRQITRTVIRQWRRMQSLRELGELDQRTLKDIGLSRGEFNMVAEHYADYRCYSRGTTSSCANRDNRR